jgi:hypothetical protein
MRSPYELEAGTSRLFSDGKDIALQGNRKLLNYPI